MNRDKTSGKKRGEKALGDKSPRSSDGNAMTRLEFRSKEFFRWRRSLSKRE